MTDPAQVRGEPVQPYVGLRPYLRADHARFFARERETREVATIWQAAGLTVLFGASGVGKTSLLHAGVLSRIETERADVLPIARVSPRGFSTRGTANPYVLALLSAWAPDEPLSVLAGLTVSEFLAGRPERTDRYGDPVPTLAAVDQAEELFGGSLRGEEDRGALLAQLVQAVDEHPGLHLLLSLREEHLAAVLPYERPLGRGSRARFHLLPFTPAAALDAVTKPIEGTGRFFARGAAELLVNDLQTTVIANDEGDRTILTLKSIEPVQLQVVCSALWESLPPSLREITSEHVNLHVNVDRFLTGFCRTALDAVAAEHDVPPAELGYWLRNAFVTEHGTRNTVYEGLQETAGMPNAVARALEDRHVLKAEHRLGIRWYELQHDRLISSVRGPERPASYLRDARELLARQSWESAGRLAEEAARVAEFDEVWVRAEVKAILGEVAAARGEVETARAHLREAAETFAVLQRFDGVARALTADGRLRLAQGEYAEAVDVLKSALSWAPNDMFVQSALGQALWWLGQPLAALAMLNGAVNLAGEPPVEALALRGEILADLGRSDEALRDLNRVRHHQRAGTVAARALALAQAQRLDAAEQEILDATGAEPGNGPVLLRAARVNALLGRTGVSADLAARALEAGDPGLPPHLRGQAGQLLLRSA
ncbi:MULTISPECIES: tetratricopeptide repeat protein [Streptosporangium]|uniref:tetratricopeptide repeat protein n=1 Tax=Streptosporangium TaxID=2000 RepID=UPI003333B623